MESTVAALLLDASQPPPGLIFLFPVIFIGFWLFVTFIISRCGWQKFAARYPAPLRPPGCIYNSPRASFGLLTNYKGAVRVIFTDAGVYFYVLFLFRAFHPPFLVPWSSVKSLHKVDGFFGSHYLLDIDDPAGKIRARLPAKIEPELLRFPQAVTTAQ